MKIKIEKIENDEVYIDTGYGIAKGSWEGNDAPTLSRYHVKLKPKGEYRFEDFRVTDIDEYHTEIIDDKNVMTLTIISYEGDGWLLAQFGDSSMNVKVENDERFHQLGRKFLRIEVDDLYIYDLNTPADWQYYDMSVPEVAQKCREEEERLEKEQIKEAWMARKKQMEEESELKRKGNIKFLAGKLALSIVLDIVGFAVILGLIFFFDAIGPTGWRGSMATIGASGYALVGYGELKIRMVLDLVDEIKKSREWRRKKKKESDQMK